MLPPPLPPDLFDSLPPAVQAYNRYLEGRLADLEGKLNQNSSNSSRPPSSDGPQRKPAPPKTPSGRRRGGQPGHPRHDRILLPLDEGIDHKPARCRRCAAALTGDDPHPLVDQVFDLPERLRHVVHHRRHTLACPCCHAHTTAPPVPQAASGFGPKLTAAVAYLSGVGRLSKRTIRTLLDDLCGLPVSLGSVSKLEQTVSRALSAYGGPLAALTVPPCEFLLDYEDDEDEDAEPTKRQRKKPWRYRWPDVFRDEVLALLLDLNKQRAAAELTAAENAPTPAKKSRKTPSKSKKPGGTTGTGQQDLC